MRRVDLTGRHFSRLSVVRRDTGRYWVCVCVCGRRTRVRQDHLLHGHIRSCGCFHDEVARTGNTIHGHHPRGSSTPEYRSWSGMIRRCCRSSDKRWADYGGRGITICVRWRRDFRSFLEDMGLRPDWATSIDRIDVNGNYEPSNCRWATATQQARNTRYRRVITIHGVSRTLAEWQEATGVDKRRISARLAAGWPEDDVLSPSVASRTADVSSILRRWDNEESQTAIAASLGVSPARISKVICSARHGASE